MPLHPLLTASGMRAADRATMTTWGLPGRVLMETAGRAACDAIIARWPVSGRRVTVLAGAGNNGGDGLVMARVLHARGADVRVVTLADPESATKDTGANLALAVRLAEGSDRLRVDRFESIRSLAAAPPPDLVVDALLGVGVTGALREPVRTLAAWANRQSCPVVAVDLPTGLDVDTGAAADDTVRADLTVAMAALKVGLLVGDGPACAGDVVAVEIGIPDAEIDRAASATRADDAWVAQTLPRRAADAHKYSAGRALCVVGSRAFSGAAILSTLAAYRAGAGAVVACTPASAAPTVDARALEVMVDRQPETDAGTLSIPAYDAIVDRAERADAVLIGCGLGDARETGRLVAALVRRITAPLVLDADGLSAFAGQADRLADAASAGLVLTPHLGELRRLLGDADVVPTDRVETVRQLAARWNAVVVLKGMPSVVGAPDGRVRVGPPGRPALATAGTGDVLAGLTVGLLAQGLDPFDAATCALALGSAAADAYADRHGPSGLVASDLVDLVPGVVAARFSAP